MMSAKITRWTCSALLFPLTMLISLDLGSQSPNLPVSGWTIERFLRMKATKVIRPDYPEDAIRAHKTGVAVAQIWLNQGGGVSKVEVLEAPCESIANSLRRAVTQWRFEAFTDNNGQPIVVSGKLTFYFQITNGKGTVLDPADTGYVGHWPEKGHPPSAQSKTISVEKSFTQAGSLVCGEQHLGEFYAGRLKEKI